jgi:hypothetical protein
MAKAESNAATSLAGTPELQAHTVDDLFQYLVRVCDILPAAAKKEILEKLQLDKLQVDLHIRGGTREILPLCPAEREDELQDKEFTAVVMFHVYRFAPPEGVTERVPFQWWDAGSVLCLTIRDEHLIIEPNWELDYPWDAYSFTVVNWSLVEELWPNPNRTKPDVLLPALESEDPPPLSAAPIMVTQQEWWDTYLTPETKAKLAVEYKNITKASEAINLLMENDATIKGAAYRPRVIENRLREHNIFPKRRSSRSR